ncbi:homocysteine S-methyltransferase [Bacillus mojavensis]|uniref:homocysteine S-methyltransferase n=1 Tax=Bacillus mojavensis TaxID=72360 RepID=UPI000287DE56|nr:homocysteine S-methyltransferase [Bacillus mojavensis]MDR4228852.1 homocysteine S-methyltransferase [Bacillus mojavensis]MEC3587126.1 homocysteine S-methyltransferase [Bacillus mojavensis]MEC5242316.1 homocysteine S-methyltransferase [Bacillus mojavensis]MED0750936.1 homocysteine S-methyltransferase [Bacillus mojavensis]
MNPIQHLLDTYPLIVLDGAMATELERKGCDLNDSLWSAKILMEQPELIKQVHADYFAAGADCAITASYQSTFEGFAARGLSEAEARRLIQMSVSIAAEARDEFWAQKENRLNRPKPIVAASVGPYGAYLADGSEYRGNYGITEEELAEFHRPRMKALIDAGADVLACETIPCLTEAKAIVSLLKEFPDTYAWFSFSAKDGLHISDGTPAADCASWLDQHSQAAAVGINCTPLQHISSLIAELKKNTSKPIIVYPNSGEQYDPDTKTWNGAACGEPYGQSARIWFENGAKLIGGCCRTKPEDIKEIAGWARTLKTT